jgi:hypothetical protein
VELVWSLGLGWRAFVGKCSPKGRLVTNSLRLGFEEPVSGPFVLVADGSERGFHDSGPEVGVRTSLLAKQDEL